MSAAEDLDERCGACGGMPRYAVGVEYRNVGEHEWDSGFTCMGCRCPWGDVERAKAPCPSVQERRLVGPWEPAPSEGEAP